MLNRIKYLFAQSDTDETTSEVTYTGNAPLVIHGPAQHVGSGNRPSGDMCIRLLRETEQKGAEKIKQARVKRTNMIKRARIEAEGEINQFKVRKDAEITAKLNQVKLDIKAESVLYDKIIEKELENYKVTVEANKQAIIDKLFREVCLIKPVPHHNLIVKKQIESTGNYKRIFPIIERK